MSCGPFRSALNHCVIPPASCQASKRVPEKLGGTTQHAKIFKSNCDTNLEMLSSKHWSMRHHNVISTLFSLVFFFGKMSRGPFLWALSHCAVLVSNCASKRVPDRLGGTARYAKCSKSNRVTSLEMYSSQHWSLRYHNVIFALFSLVISRKNELGREPLCHPPGAMPGKQTCFGKARMCRTTCKRFQE